MDKEWFEQLYGVLNDFSERLERLEHSVNDIIIQSLVEANEEFEYQDAVGGFKNRYAELVGPIEGKLKTLYGDDFDVYKELYDSMDTSVEGFDEESYVSEQIAIVNEKLNALIEAVAPKVETEETETVTKPNDVEDVETVPTEEQLMEELNAYEK